MIQNGLDISYKANVVSDLLLYMYVFGKCQWLNCNMLCLKK